MTCYGFIGLGNMGGGMAAVLAAAGHKVQAFDLSADALQRAVNAGAQASDSASAAVAGADVVITMLPAGVHVRDVYEQAVLPAAVRDALVIDCSTVDVDTARAVAEQAQGASLRAADAPVSRPAERRVGTEARSRWSPDA